MSILTQSACPRTHTAGHGLYNNYTTHVRRPGEDTDVALWLNHHSGRPELCPLVILVTDSWTSTDMSASGVNRHKARRLSPVGECG